MDCRTASELIMKYLDGEISAQEEKLLHGHIDFCKDCRLELEAMKCTYSMLEDVEFEDPPEDLEQKVLSRIRKEEIARNNLKAWEIGALVFSAILAGLAGLIYLFIFTPFVSIMIDNFKSLQIISNGLVRYLGKVLYTSITAFSKFLTVGRALGIAQRALVETYSTIVIFMVLPIIIIIKFHNQIFKFSRR